jgi:DNA-binding GntR family transcriptional regulator
VLSGISDDAPWRSVVEPDMSFHRAIIDAAGSPRLARAYSSVQSEILLCLVQLRPYYHRPAEVAAEHVELIAAIRSGDVSEAEELFRVHLAEAADNLTKAWQEQTGESVVV